MKMDTSYNDQICQTSNIPAKIRVMKMETGGDRWRQVETGGDRWIHSLTMELARLMSAMMDLGLAVHLRLFKTTRRSQIVCRCC